MSTFYFLRHLLYIIVEIVKVLKNKLNKSLYKNKIIICKSKFVHKFCKIEMHHNTCQFSVIISTILIDIYSILGQADIVNTQSN